MRQAEEPDNPPKEGRLRRGLRVARELRDDPRRAGPLLRSAALDIWRSRGGGFYGLGYLVTFVILEVRMIIGDAMEASGAAEFAMGQALELVFRLSFLSFLNIFQALLWPAFVLQLYGGPGIILLVGSYLAFEHACKPGIERLFPELREHREQVAARKAASKAVKKTRRPGGPSSQHPDQ
jgi:hypothetical protein